MRHRLGAALLALAAFSDCAPPAALPDDPAPAVPPLVSADASRSDAVDAGEPFDAGSALDGGADAGTTPDSGEGCTLVGGNSTVIATAPSDDDFALQLTARSASRTRWSETGNEALVLEVSGAHGLVGHLILHQGASDFVYGMQVGRLVAGEPISVRVSSLSAASAVKQACLGQGILTSATELGAAGEGLVHAPIYKWPVSKRFDDVPVLVGWSAGGKSYSGVFTNENGGTPMLCGGGAQGMAAEIARWGRGSDIETSFEYGGAVRSWYRCTGATSFDTLPPRTEGEHPVFYYGDGHNRVFESRSGYGATCGTHSDQRADGDLDGWNIHNPGSEESKDGPYVVVLRPLPVALDALGFRGNFGRREGLIDTYAPWIYRLTDLELRREGKVDQSHTFGLEQYLYVDVHASDVGGSGDGICTFRTTGGFKLIAHAGATALVGPQMTADYFGASGPGSAWKRLAIPLRASYAASAISRFTFDAFDNDGIFLLDVGAAFIPAPVGDNGATLRYVRQGVKALNVYVDDDDSGCVGGINRSGPGGLPYPCHTNLYDFPSQ